MSFYPVIFRPGRVNRFEPVPRDPFTLGAALLTFVSSGTGLALGAGSFVVAANVIGYVTIGALVAGAQFALNKTLSDKAAPGLGGGSNVYGANSPEMRQNVTQSVPAQRWIYGTIWTGGPIFILDDSKPPYLTMGVAYSARRIAAVNAIKVGINEVAFTEIVLNSILQPIPGEGVDYSAHFFASLRDGRTTQEIDPLLADEFPLLETTFRQRGIATGVYRFYYGADREDFEAKWGQVAIPNVLANISGCHVYDPRDPTQDPNEELTWKYSNNAALCQADYMRHPFGLNFPVDRMRWDRVAESADFDDEIVATASGELIRRHTINGVVSLDQKPQDVMEALLTANRGFVVQSRGIGFVSSCQPRDPVMTIADSILVAGFEFRDDRPKKDVLNKLTSKFPARDREYNDTDGPIYERTDYQDDDGEILEANVRTPFTDDDRIVQRLQRQYVEDSRLGRAFQGTVKLRARRLEIGDCVRIYSKLFPNMNGLYTVEDMGFDDAFSSIFLSLAEYDPTISKNWIAAEHEKAFTLPDLEVA